MRNRVPPSVAGCERACFRHRQLTPHLHGDLSWANVLVVRELCEDLVQSLVTVGLCEVQAAVMMRQLPIVRP